MLIHKTCAHFYFFFHGDESIRTTKYIGQVSSGLIHVATVNVSSSVQAKQRLLLTSLCDVKLYIYITPPNWLLSIDV